VAEILGMKFSGWLWRGLYLSKLPGFQKEVRIALDWRSWIWSSLSTALAHDFASGGSVQTREHITNNSPTVEQEEDEV
jgi:hypothetical protein